MRHALIESDCLLLVQDIEQLWDHDVEVRREGVSAEVKENTSFSSRPWDIRIVWCKREQNEAADRLARHALVGEYEFVQLQQIPADVQDVVVKDKQSILH